MNNVQISFHGGVGWVTGANFLLKVGNTSILVDCGLVQGGKDSFWENRKEFPYNVKDIQYLFVTHAHLDHVGRIPKLVKDGFNGEIWSTQQTKDIAYHILMDAVHLIARESEHAGVLPIYDPKDVEKAFSLWKTFPYYERKEFPFGIAYSKDAGHILGSCMFHFEVQTEKGVRTIVFTGDLGNSPSVLLNDTDTLQNVDYLVMESVYGDRNHEPAGVRSERFRKIIIDTVKKGGAIVIPAFSLERTQVLLYELNSMIEHEASLSVPVFVDSPLATKITDVYRKSENLFKPEIQKAIQKGDDIFSFPRLHFTPARTESEAIIKTPNPKIVIAGSGMSTGGRIGFHEIHHLPDPNSTILLVGYQTVGTLGRQLLDGVKQVRIMGQDVPVRARIEMINGFSAHKDSDHLIEFVEDTKNTLKQVFTVMGEPKASMFLSQRLRDYLGVNAVYPEKDKVYSIV